MQKDKDKQQLIYKPKNKAYSFSKIIIYNLDEIIEGIPLKKLPKNKKSIEKFLHKAIDEIFCEVNIFITRESEGNASMWLKNNKPYVYSEWIKNNAIYSYYILDSEKFEHYKVNKTIDLLNDFMSEQRKETSYNKYSKLHKKGD